MSPKAAPRNADDITLTHPDKELYPDAGVTKRDLAAYFSRVAPRLLPFAAGRLLSLVRCPDGQDRPCFFQRHRGKGMSPHIHVLERSEKKGSDAGYIYIEGEAGLMALAQIGVLEIHVWGSRIDDIERPDRVVFDLDPGPGVDFESVKTSAEEMRDLLGALDLESFALLTGGKGIHVVVPIQRRHGWSTIKAFSGALANRLASDQPHRYVATMTKSRREGRIFIDYFRNDRSATAIAPYSTRARPGAPLAWPVTWAGLKKVRASNEVTIDTCSGRLRQADPWRGYHGAKQGLRAAVLRALDIEE